MIIKFWFWWLAWQMEHSSWQPANWPGSGSGYKYSWENQLQRLMSTMNWLNLHPFLSVFCASVHAKLVFLNPIKWLFRNALKSKSWKGGLELKMWGFLENKAFSKVIMQACAETVGCFCRSHVKNSIQVKYQRNLYSSCHWTVFMFQMTMWAEIQI